MKADFIKLYYLQKRNLKVFLKDRATVFFSLLAPLIVLLLYILFLGDVQMQNIKSFIPEGVTVDDKLVAGFLDSWMISGVLSVACITVSLGANNVMVQDLQKGIINDTLSSPVNRKAVTAGYFVYNFIVTVLIVSIAFAVSILYLVIKGSFFLSVADVLSTFGFILLSSLSATMITVFVSAFFRTESAFSAFNGIMSAAIGFVIGAYMPISFYPKALQNFILFIPGTHSAALFRNSLMQNAFEKLTAGTPDQFAQGLEQAFSMKLDFFGANVPFGAMILVIAGSSILFFLLNIFIAFRKKFK